MKAAKYIFLIIIVVLVICYADLLLQRANGQKTLGGNEFIWCGVFLAILIVFNIKNFYNQNK